ncbi:hypothetical protein OSB04_016599 [Centaurea solstitialis]|uniref:Zinc finger CCCH domain-containing protein 5 n=1 Tax=Centaurea solstitialis TaxID=347529 RepID=A0AA38T198_9ASTR|nr:hypothetical protein OSB04_016599 [Centaurea solstitialis]
MEDKEPKFLSRKEKRKALKKDKRKQLRKELAEKARAEEEARINDPEEQRRIQMEEEMEKESLERERMEFEERERIFLQELERKKKMEEEEEERRSAAERELKLKQEGVEDGSNEDDEWEYVEEGPPEIIWQGNEIIVKKNKVRVKKKDANQHIEKEDPNRPTSNPLPPQSEAYAASKNAPMMSSAELLDTVAQQVPNFGTEQDKAHCPFHIKTGACRFGLRCNRVHYYPDKSSTLLIKNMYNGPGLAWEQDEGLEYTDEEVEHSYEEFYEDVHTEFLKFGEIINFKVCRNGSFHLRGNVYVNYKSLDSAVMAHNSVNGRYFAGKQIKCEFVSLTKWKVAICGEYMKSRLKTCSRGSACNFLHCFSNPGGDYEWADCDKPPPRYWVKKMIALFGYSDDSWHDKQIEQPSPHDQQHSSKIFTSDRDSYHYKRHRSSGTNQQDVGSGRSRHEENRARKSRHHEQKKDDKSYEDETEYRNNHRGSSIAVDTDSGRDRNAHRRHRASSEKRSRHSRSRTHGSSSDEDFYRERRHVYKKRRSRHRENISESSNDDRESDDELQRQSSSKPSEPELQKHKEGRANFARYHRRSRHEDHPQSEKEIFTEKKQRRHRKSASLHRRSRSWDSGHLSEENDDRSDRWDPNDSPNETGKDSSNKVEISDDERPKDRETHSGSLEEELKNRQSRDREKREKI